MNLPYRPELKKLAREMRNRSTIAEVLLWNHLKRGQRRGLDFHRQKPVADYIVDLFAPELMLAIEIDGDTHRFKAADDHVRQQRLEGLGIRFLRFGHTEVKENANGIAAEIDRWIDANRKTDVTGRNTPRPSATPLKRGSS